MKLLGKFSDFYGTSVSIAKQGALVLIFFCFNFCNPSEELPEKTTKEIEAKEKKSLVSDNKPEALIYHAVLKGAITPSAKETLNTAINEAEEKKAKALLLELDTPGGLASSMDDIIRRILNARVPVITYVSPPGATCGSAGVYIMYASHIAAMAPATNIGSATPVSIGGGSPVDSGDGSNKKDKAKKNSDRIPKVAGANDGLNMKRKILNHARAQIRSLAQYHKRNVNFAERTVTEAINLSSQEAHKSGAIDFLASDIDDLLKKAHGRKCTHGIGLCEARFKKYARGFFA